MGNIAEKLSVYNLNKQVEHIEFGGQRYGSTDNYKKWNGYCNCTIEFDDFIENFDEIIKKVSEEPKLKDYSLHIIVTDTLNAIKNSLNDITPNIFHNTYILYNDFGILQLKNKIKIKELSEQNKILINEGIFQGFSKEGNYSKEVLEKLLNLKIVTEESSWDFRIQEKIRNNVYSLKPVMNEPFPYQTVYDIFKSATFLYLFWKSGNYALKYMEKYYANKE